MENDDLRAHIKRIIVQHGVNSVVTALVGAFEDEASKYDPESHNHRRFQRLALKAKGMENQ